MQSLRVCVCKSVHCTSLYLLTFWSHLLSKISSLLNMELGLPHFIGRCYFIDHDDHPWRWLLAYQGAAAGVTTGSRQEMADKHCLAEGMYRTFG